MALKLWTSVISLPSSDKTPTLDEHKHPLYPHPDPNFRTLLKKFHNKGKRFNITQLKALSTLPTSCMRLHLMYLFLNYFAHLKSLNLVSSSFPCTFSIWLSSYFTEKLEATRQALTHPPSGKHKTWPYLPSFYHSFPSPHPCSNLMPLPTLVGSHPLPLFQELPTVTSSFPFTQYIQPLPPQPRFSSMICKYFQFSPFKEHLTWTVILPSAPHPDPSSYLFISLQSQILKVIVICHLYFLISHSLLDLPQSGFL